MKKLNILSNVDKYFNALSKEQSAKIFAGLAFVRMGQTEGVSIKTLKGKVKELIVKQDRIIFFEHAEVIYVIDAFKKQSKKTPKRIIERAENIYYKVIHE